MQTMEQAGAWAGKDGQWVDPWKGGKIDRPVLLSGHQAWDGSLVLHFAPAAARFARHTVQRCEQWSMRLPERSLARAEGWHGACREMMRASVLWPGIPHSAHAWFKHVSTGSKGAYLRACKLHYADKAALISRERTDVTPTQYWLKNADAGHA